MVLVGGGTTTTGVSVVVGGGCGGDFVVVVVGVVTGVVVGVVAGGGVVTGVVVVVTGAVVGVVTGVVTGAVVVVGGGVVAPGACERDAGCCDAFAPVGGTRLRAAGTGDGGARFRAWDRDGDASAICGDGGAASVGERNGRRNTEVWTNRTAAPAPTANGTAPTAAR
ncbi:MAG TPA: hypothetical protein VLW49_06090 [Gaiellaceae bacterium]|nr:hypothetical protein [Gaiellaceae bacterium]